MAGAPHPAALEEAAPPPPGPVGATLAHHLVAALLFALALYFTALFQRSNQGLWQVFPSLLKPYSLSGGAMNWKMLGWAGGAAALYLLLGWFFVEALEVYIPKSAQAALSFILGMGLCGFAFEILAMAGELRRRPIFIAAGALLAILWPLAVWATRRRPEAWGGGEGGAIEQAIRRSEARAKFDKSLVWPARAPEFGFAALAVALIALITLAIFWHALLYPEVYWDSMILYLGYARMMFLEHGIVRKVTGQVGIGLGANYPHLYGLLGAATSAAGREWSELPQRLIAPLAGLASTLLVGHTALRLTRHVNFALAVALLYRAVPLGVCYDQYASDYALSILFCAAFLYCAMLYIETALSGYFILMTALIALAMHLNYLMGILWVPWALAVAFAHVRLPAFEDEDSAERIEELARAAIQPTSATVWIDEREEDPEWTRRWARPGLGAFLTGPLFALTFILSAAVGSVWLLRNWHVTGNPVYAFFYKIFGGVNISDEVMQSAGKEWLANGDGIGRLGQTPWERIRASWVFFADQRVWTGAWKLQPFFLGFALPGGAILLARSLAGFFRRVEGRDRLGHPVRVRVVDFGARFGLVALALVIVLLGYHYFLASYYLYQIVMILPALAVLSSFSFPYWRMRTGWRALFGALALLAGLTPGLTMALMGFKVTGAVASAEGGRQRLESPLDLYAFRHPLPGPETIYQWRYGADATMFGYLNRHLQGKKLLTHENRHLALDPSIEIVQLDDWAMQTEIWPLPPRDKIKALKSLNIGYYLFVPNERNHPALAKMGASDWPKQGLAVEEYRAGENILYRLK